MRTHSFPRLLHYHAPSSLLGLVVYYNTARYQSDSWKERHTVGISLQGLRSLYGLMHWIVLGNRQWEPSGPDNEGVQLVLEIYKSLSYFLFLLAGLGVLTIVVPYAVNELGSKTTKRVVWNYRTENSLLIGYEFIKPLSHQAFYRSANMTCFGESETWLWANDGGGTLAFS